MLKQQDLAKIFNAFSAKVKNRKIVTIYDAGERYILVTKSEGMNLDPYYFYNKKNGVIVHSSVMPFLTFRNLLATSRDKVVWES